LKRNLGFWFLLFFSMFSSLSYGEGNSNQTNTERDYYVPARSYGTTRVLQPPSYSKTLNSVKDSNLETVNWVEAGADYRARSEYRENDLRRADEKTTRPVLLRARGYLGIKERLDPFRFVVEVEDAQRRFSPYEIDNRDINRMEAINAFVELYFKKLDYLKRPIRLRSGIMSFELLDRRLIASNEWRNTTNTFQGLRLTIGEDKNNWSLDFLALQPLDRIPEEQDRPVRNQFFGGLVGHVRNWSNILTIEPFYLGLKQGTLEQVKWNPIKLAYEPNNRVGKEIHTLGARVYNVYKWGIDYDSSMMFQFGVNDKVKQERHEARAFTFEVGYLFASKWKPRVGLFFGFASGDKNPKDNLNQRFERLYGFGRPWSSQDYIQMENIKAQKIIFELEPIKKIRLDTALVWFHLASATDRWNSGNGIRDERGWSGNYLGMEYNFRLRISIFPHSKINLGYALFKTGEFVMKVTDRNQNSHFSYLEITLELFDH
jgi:hypothetical protein